MSLSIIGGLLFRRALAPAAVLLLVSACSGRANNLNTYYDDPPVEPTQPAIAAPKPSPTQARITTTTPTTTTPVVDIADALLTDRDLASEGVESASSFSYAPLQCAPDTSASWSYPSGSTIDQTVQVLPDAAGRIAEMRAEGTCLDGAGVEGPELGELGDDRFSWCFTDAETRGCAAAVAKGELLTVVVVKAGSTDRAGEAIARIAPLAAAALDRV